MKSQGICFILIDGNPVMQRPGLATVVLFFVLVYLVHFLSYCFLSCPYFFLPVVLLPPCRSFSLPVVLFPSQSFLSSFSRPSHFPVVLFSSQSYVFHLSFTLFLSVALFFPLSYFRAVEAVEDHSIAYTVEFRTSRAKKSFFEERLGLSK